MSAHRQSALLLHGLGSADQRWILERLDGDDRLTLESHLSELKSLGIPAAPALAAAASAPRGTGARGKLMAASGARMAQLLADEPLWMVRHLLALGDWPWRQAYLDTLAGARRERAASAPGTPLQEALAARLLDDLGAQLDDVSPALLPVRRAGALQAMRNVMRRWI